MTQYILKIVANGKVIQQQTIDAGSAMQIPVKENIEYQLFDVQGRLLAKTDNLLVQQDLWVYANQNSGLQAQPDLILQGYTQYMPDGLLPTSGALTPMVSVENSVAASLVSSGVGMNPWVIGGLAALAGGGAIAAGASGGSDNNDNNSTSNQSAVQPPVNPASATPPTTVVAPPTISQPAPAVPTKPVVTAPPAPQPPVNPAPTTTPTTVVAPPTISQPAPAVPTQPVVTAPPAPQPPVNPAPTTTPTTVVTPPTISQPAPTVPTQPVVTAPAPQPPVNPAPTTPPTTVVAPPKISQPAPAVPTQPVVTAPPAPQPPVNPVSATPPTTVVAPPTVSQPAPTAPTQPVVTAPPAPQPPVNPAPATPPTTVVAPPTISQPAPQPSKPVVKQPEPLKIQLHSLTADNAINASEAMKSQKLMISGQVSGGEANKVHQIDIVLNNGQGQPRVVATVDVKNQQFSYEINADELLNNQEYKIIAREHGNDTNFAVKSYEVKPEAAADVRIKQVSGDHSVDLYDLNQTVRLHGKVVLDGEFAKGENKKRLTGIDVKIDGQTYHAGIVEENQTFYIDINKKEWVAANGKHIEYKFYHTDKIIALVPEDPNAKFSTWDSSGKVTHQAKAITTPELTEKNIQWLKMDDLGSNHRESESNSFIKNHTVESNHLVNDLKIEISGTVSGVAKKDDIVSIKIGNGENHDVVVDEHLNFKLQLNINDNTAGLLNLKSTNPTAIKASATLKTIDLSGKPIEVVDQVMFEYAPKQTGKHVIEAKKIAYNDLPNFIQLLEIEQHSKEIEGKTPTITYQENSVPYGGKQDGKLEIGYYFKKQADFGRWDRGYNPKEFPLAPDGQDLNKQAVRDALQKFEDYTNIKFTEKTHQGHGTITFVLKDVMKGALLQPEGQGSGFEVILGQKYFSAPEGEKSMQTTNAFTTVLHETMHILGAGHSFFEPQKRTNGKIYLNDDLDSRGITSMSYDKDGDFIGTKDLRPYDLAYLHYRFGVNKDARKDNDTYQFKTFNRQSADGDIYIWDGGGIDTFDASNEAKGVYVNLTPGSYIYNDVDNMPKDNAKEDRWLGLNGVYGKNAIPPKEILTNRLESYKYLDGVMDDYFKDNLKAGENVGRAPEELTTKLQTTNFLEGISFIGYNTQLENIIGSAHNDILIGNQADNHIYGGKGADKIEGGEGNDYLNGGEGIDTLQGGAGGDVYVVDNSQDKIENEQANQDIDTVYSSAETFRLPENVENIILIGEAKNAHGNSGNNEFIGNHLANEFTGGGGNDSFVFKTALNGTIDTIQDFNQGDKLVLSKLIFSGIDDLNDIANHISYDKTTGKVGYDADGLNQGTDDVVYFANIGTALDQLSQQNFELIA